MLHATSSQFFVGLKSFLEEMEQSCQEINLALEMPVLSEKDGSFARPLLERMRDKIDDMSTQAEMLDSSPVHTFDEVLTHGQDFLESIEAQSKELQEHLQQYGFQSCVAEVANTPLGEDKENCSPVDVKTPHKKTASPARTYISPPTPKTPSLADFGFSATTMAALASTSDHGQPSNTRRGDLLSHTAVEAVEVEDRNSSPEIDFPQFATVSCESTRDNNNHEYSSVSLIGEPGAFKPTKSRPNATPTIDYSQFATISHIEKVSLSPAACSPSPVADDVQASSAQPTATYVSSPSIDYTQFATVTAPSAHTSPQPPSSSPTNAASPTIDYTQFSTIAAPSNASPSPQPNAQPCSSSTPTASPTIDYTQFSTITAPRNAPSPPNAQPTSLPTSPTIDYTQFATISAPNTTATVASSRTSPTIDYDTSSPQPTAQRTSSSVYAASPTIDYTQFATVSAPSNTHVSSPKTRPATAAYAASPTIDYTQFATISEPEDVANSRDSFPQEPLPSSPAVSETGVPRLLQNDPCSPVVDMAQFSTCSAQILGEEVLLSPPRNKAASNSVSASPNDSGVTGSPTMCFEGDNLFPLIAIISEEEFVSIPGFLRKQMKLDFVNDMVDAINDLMTDRRFQFENNCDCFKQHDIETFAARLDPRKGVAKVKALLLVLIQLHRVSPDKKGKGTRYMILQQ